MSDRARLLAAHVRAMSDDDLNDVLVELPRERFAMLLDQALGQPRTGETAVPLHLRRFPALAGEVSRWAVHARRPLQVTTTEPILAVVEIGQVVQVDLGATASWIVCTCRPAPGDPRRTWAPCTCQPGQAIAASPLFGWRRRRDAVAALAERTPATGARCRLLAIWVRALADDDLGDLLVGLPPGRFDGLLRATFGEPVGAGEAA